MEREHEESKQLLLQQQQAENLATLSKDHEANAADRFDLKSMPTFKDKPINQLTAEALEKVDHEWPMKVFYKEIKSNSENGDGQEKDCFMWPPESTADVLSDEEQLIWLASQTPAMI